jgi:endonuclease G
MIFSPQSQSKMKKNKKSKEQNSTTSKPSAALMEQLKQFVRTKGPEFLKDPNISSIGIGYKVTDGVQTGQISIQFTVKQKAAPEALESLTTEHIPASIQIGGISVPTDVLERQYVPAFRIVAESVSSSRKKRTDPIQPGISLSNRKGTAGTIGCIVYDRTEGTPYVLSNWHVLQGANGAIGDKIVQPGPFDDNRLDKNYLGRLVRSHLGSAGDCAVCSIESRKINPSVLSLNVTPTEIGEPELGDKVTKSGRTTNVTHGIVSRIHTLVQLDYGGSTGTVEIGCFEITPDPQHLPGNGEISDGGDSGSLWMFKSANNKATSIMAGLHFAGESSNAEPEHALACYPKSVLEKLDISLKPATATPPKTLGYNPNFLSTAVAEPKLNNSADAFKLKDSTTIDYTHFSLALSKTRHFAILVAWNIDGNSIKKISRKGIDFTLDKRIPESQQIGEPLYKNNGLDRGHIARRADLLWGSDAEAKQANKDSFFFTNIAPQMDNFNQSGKGGVWGKLEDALFEEADVENLRVSLFGGPVFRSDDKTYRGVKIPREFFKVLAFVEAGRLKAKAFLLTQNLSSLEAFELEPFKVFEVALEEIETRCKFKFPDNLREADHFPQAVTEAAGSERKPLESVADIVW